MIVPSFPLLILPPLPFTPALLRGLAASSALSLPAAESVSLIPSSLKDIFNPFLLTNSIPQSSCFLSLKKRTSAKKSWHSSSWSPILNSLKSALGFHPCRNSLSSFLSENSSGPGESQCYFSLNSCILGLLQAPLFWGKREKKGALGVPPHFSLRHTLLSVSLPCWNRFLWQLFYVLSCSRGTHEAPSPLLLQSSGRGIAAQLSPPSGESVGAAAIHQEPTPQEAHPPPHLPVSLLWLIALDFSRSLVVRLQVSAAHFRMRTLWKVLFSAVRCLFLGNRTHFTQPRSYLYGNHSCSYCMIC
nr:uncharacterized protein LOC107973976 [Pan troglodytes]XP_054535557.1 uncharacterized protein LOC107973976 [Pan troglodytes]